MKLHLEKSPDIDEITNEYIKFSKARTLTFIMLLRNTLFDEEIVPRLLTESDIDLLYKKDNPIDNELLPIKSFDLPVTKNYLSPACSKEYPQTLMYINQSGKLDSKEVPAQWMIFKWLTKG
ncbi:hypothetical protein EVAR_96993_1 [Eumeta japonica]|uniref:Uncharacterized protein n=1 Tax=Eumeta variegata TaxID=151549 RepID=A0A4C1VEG3_EUMVA|nr:hypothetical protein EVAR_96993_1 [Eumeta japonica]